MIMKSSQALNRFLAYHPNALEDPIKYFGPNHETLLNFWHYLDSLNLYIVTYKFPYVSNPYSLENYCRHIVENQLNVWSSASPGTFRRSPLGYASLEIVCMHKIFEDGLTLTYLPRLEKAIKASLETVH